MTQMEAAMNKKIEEFKNKLKADNLKPEVKRAIERKIKMLEGGKIVTK